MDNINQTNLYSISVCELNTKFNDRCQTDWGKNNIISLVTLEGIYLLKPQLDIKHGPFVIELIRNPKNRFCHKLSTNNSWPKFDSCWTMLNHFQYMDVFLDPALMTNLETQSLDIYSRRFKFAKWSTLIDEFPKQCHLATITNDYQLSIYAKVNNVWLVHADLSSEYDKLWSQLHNRDTNIAGPQGGFESIKRNLHSLSFCNMCWKSTQQNVPVLIAATIPGDIIFWKLMTKISTTTNNLNKKQTSFYDIKTILQTDIQYITSMNLYENLLIVSARDGRVVLYDLSTNFTELDAETNCHTNGTTTNGNPPVKTLSIIKISPTATLWHQDNIEVTDFYIQPLMDDTFRIALAKSTNICWCLINYTKPNNGNPATLSISDSFSAIDGLDPDVSLHQTPATWLKPAGNRKAVLIADDGSFFQLEFTDDLQETSPEFNSIRTGRVDLSRMVPRGLCTSPSGHLITMISSISNIYDPVKVQAPSKLLLLPTVNNKAFFLDCVRKIVDDDWYATAKITSPMDVCDIMDYLKSVYSLLTYEDFSALYKSLKETVLKTNIPQNLAESVKLKLISSFMLRLCKHSDHKMTDIDQQVDLDHEVHNKILLYNLRQVLTLTLDSSHSENTYIKLSQSQITSLKNIFTWLSTVPDGKRMIDEQGYSEKFDNLMKNYNQDDIIERCPVCTEIIPFEKLKIGTCDNKHQFDRCARSLLVIDLIGNTELICEYCFRHYMSNLVWPPDNQWLCSFCQ